MPFLTDQFVIADGIRYVICLWITIGLPGLGWAPVLAPAYPQSQHRRLRPAWQIGWILVTGYLLHLVVVCLLAVAGLVSLTYLLVASCLLSLVGARLQTRNGNRRPAWDRKRRSFLYVCGVLVVWAGLVFSAPGRSANVVGGWDPGMYVNFGIKIVRTGGMEPLAPEVYQRMGQEGRDYFSRGDDDYHEVLPAVPIDLESGELKHYFFPLTPLAAAATIEQGGLRSGLRMNLFLAGMVGVALVLFLIMAGDGPVLIVGSIVALGGAPVFFYLTHLPTTEMLQCFLVIMSCIFLVRLDERGRTGICLGGVFLLAMLNRVSFLPFGAILLLSAIGVDLVTSDRRYRLGQLAPAGAALAAGWAIHMVCFPETMVRLAHIMPALYITTGVVFLLTVMLVVLPARLRVMLQNKRTCQVLRIAAALLVLVSAVGLLVYLLAPDCRENPLRMAGRLLPFLGRGVVIAGMLGLFVYTFSRRSSRELSIVLTALGVISALTLYRSLIAGIFPWASRRYLMYTVPLLVLATGYLLDGLWRMERWRPWGRWLAIVAAVATLAGGLPHSVHAALRTEYRGVPHVIERIAAEIHADDVVVVDSPKWGTPLLLMYGKKVLNGKQIWSRRDAAHTAEGLTILRVLAESGMRIRFLTTTTHGFETEASMDWESEPFHYWELIHSRRGDGFVTAEKARTFRLYTVRP